MQLQCRVASLPLQVGVPQLGRARFIGGELTLEMPRDRPVEMRPARLQLGLEIGQSELGVLEFEHGLAKRLAILGELHRFIESALRPRLRRHRDAQPFLRQLLHQMDETPPFAAQYVRLGNAAIVEEQFGCVGGMLADLV